MYVLSNVPELQALCMPSICYNCVCIKHNFGLPHLVSSSAWHWHFDQASSEEERQRIREAKYQGLP